MTRVRRAPAWFTTTRLVAAVLGALLVLGAFAVEWSARRATEPIDSAWDGAGGPPPDAVNAFAVQQFLWTIAVPAAGTLMVAAAFGLVVLAGRALAVRWADASDARAAGRAADLAADVVDATRPPGR